MLRSLVIGELGRYGHTDTIAEAQRRFSDHCSGNSLLPADLKVAVFSTCLANGDDSTYEQLVKVSELRHAVDYYKPVLSARMFLHLQRTCMIVCMIVCNKFRE